MLCYLELLGGRNTEDRSGCKVEGMINAVPIAVGTASLGALIGLEASKGRNQDKIGYNYITSEIYDEDHNDDFHDEEN